MKSTCQNFWRAAQFNAFALYLKEYRPKTTISTIRAVRQEEIDKIDEDYLGLADFYICITEDMNMSY